MDSTKYLSELKNALFIEGYDQEYSLACIKYAENLVNHNFPVVFDLFHLSLLLGMPWESLSFYIFCDIEKLYLTRTIPKRSGGERNLSIPCATLKYIQRWILDNVLYNMFISQYSMAFVKSKSILTNAQVHLGSEAILNMDIKDFFPSIPFLKVYQLFRYYGYTKEVSYLFTRLCTYKDALPQGSPTSPYLSNLVCFKLDIRLSILAQKYCAKYTRYADDMTFSGSKSIHKLIPIVIEILSDEGFEINSQKTRFTDKAQRQEITGLNINSGKVNVPRSYIRKFEQEIYYCSKYGAQNHQKHIGDHHRFYRDHMYGKAYYIHMIEPLLGTKLIDKLDRVNWED